jgi:hypothetical protein
MAKKQPQPAESQPAEPQPIEPRTIQAVADLVRDARNANKGTARGAALIESSMRTYGAGRSVLVDRNGKLIAGNKTAEGAGKAGLTGVIVVPTDGTKLVVVQRTDLDLSTDQAARELAVADNRSGQVSLEWDGAELEAVADDFGADLNALGFTDGELQDLREPDPAGRDDQTSDRTLNGARKSAVVKAVFNIAQVAVVEAAVAATGKINRGEALAEVCRFYVESKGQHDLPA